MEQREPRRFHRGPGRSPDLSHRSRDLTDTIKETRRRAIPQQKQRPPTGWVDVVVNAGALPAGDPGSEAGGITPIFKNGWGNSVDPGAAPVSYRLNRMGDIEIKGAATGGTNGSIVFFLPTDVTPAYVSTQVAVDTDGNLIQYTIHTNSAVTATVIDASSGGLAIPGATGPVGATGPPGPSQGATGPTGATGPSTGATGAAGPQGAVGQKGPTGDPGGATGATGPVGPQGASGPPGGATGAIGPSGATGASGPAGGAITIQYQFDTATADADPGIATMRLNASPQNTSTTVRISRRDIFNSDWFTVIDSLPGGKLRLAKETNLGKWIMFTVTAVTYVGTGNGYFNITVTPTASSSSNPFLLGDIIIFAFTPAGSASGPTGATGPGGGAGGATGATGATGPQGATGAAGATGATGPAGGGGAQGNTGATGATGPAGATGATGATGSTGAAGTSATRQICAAWFGTVPAATGVVPGVFVVPYVTGVSKTFNVSRVTFRLETAGTTTSTIQVERSAGGGAFSATTIKSLSLNSGENEVSSTTGFGGGGTVTSGQLLRCNWTAIGSGAATYLVELEGAE